MSLPVYTYSSIPTDTEFNAFLRPAFDKDEGQEEFPGHLLRLRDTSLSNDPTQIKGRWTTFETALLVSAGSGLSISWLGGSVVLPNNSIATISPGSTTVTANTTSYVFVNSSGVVTVSTSLALNSLPLASVVAGASSITSVSDLRPRFRVLPRANAIKIFGGSGDQGDYTLNSGSATLAEGEYYFQNFTIGASASLTISTATRIFVSGNCSISGTITCSAIGGIPGATWTPGAASNISNSPGSGFGNGRLLFGGSTYYPSVQGFGSSGGVGEAVTTTAATLTLSASGGGGGGLLIECAGSITIASGASILAKGGNATAGVLTSGSGSIAGGGGGSGGLISLRSITGITVAGTLDVRGGNGSNGVGTAGNGGGGGGGGYVALIAPTINTTGSSILLTGGTAGTYTGAIAGGGGGGGFGGTGGNANNATASGTTGSTGQLITRTFSPVG